MSIARFPKLDKITMEDLIKYIKGTNPSEDYLAAIERMTKSGRYGTEDDFIAELYFAQ